MSKRIPIRTAISTGFISFSLLSGSVTISRADTILVYQLSKSLSSAFYPESRELSGAKSSEDAYLIYNTDQSEFALVEYDKRNKEYSVNPGPLSFSQSLIAEDSRRRDNWIISFHGPGDEWDIENNDPIFSANLDTLEGREKTIRLRVNGESIRVYDLASSLRGEVLHEGADVTTDAQKREVIAGRVNMRLDTRRSSEANATDPVADGDLSNGITAAVDYLKSRGYKEE